MARCAIRSTRAASGTSTARTPPLPPRPLTPVGASARTARKPTSLASPTPPRSKLSTTPSAAAVRPTSLVALLMYSTRLLQRRDGTVRHPVPARPRLLHGPYLCTSLLPRRRDSLAPRAALLASPARPTSPPARRRVRPRSCRPAPLAPVATSTLVAPTSAPHPRRRAPSPTQASSASTRKRASRRVVAAPTRAEWTAPSSPASAPSLACTSLLPHPAHHLHPLQRRTLRAILVFPLNLRASLSFF